MRDRVDAEQLAESLVSTGNQMHVPTQAIISDMNQPLGRMVGNACEVNESLDILRGAGPKATRDLTLHLCASLLVASGKVTQTQDALDLLVAKLDSGQALRRFQQMVEHQSGKFVDYLPLANASVFASPTNGRLMQFDGQLIGQAVIELGGGRRKLSDRIDHQVGLEMLARLGDTVSAGQPLIRIFARTNATRAVAEQLLLSAVSIAH